MYKVRNPLHQRCFESEICTICNRVGKQEVDHDRNVTVQRNNMTISEGEQEGVSGSGWVIQSLAHCITSVTGSSLITGNKKMRK